MMKGSSDTGEYELLKVQGGRRRRAEGLSWGQGETWGLKPRFPLSAQDVYKLTVIFSHE